MGEVMPSIEENRSEWGEKYGWSDWGEEWSQPWGSPESQWFGTVFPRIHAFVPAPTLLEIAPGFGRWTKYLQAHCGRLIGVDLTERCVEECRRRFQGLGHVEFHVNDGTSLEMVPEKSVDFVFSCDSLVHVETDVVAAYLRQLAGKLTPDGVGFIHHSNLGAYRDQHTGALPTWVENRGWRAQTMTAAAFRDECQKAGLLCVGQEIVNWWAGILSDCFSVFTLPGSRWARPNRVIVNHRLTQEAATLSRLAQLYTAPSFESGGGKASKGVVMHVLDWANQVSRREDLIGRAMISAKRFPFVRQWFLRRKHRLLRRADS